MTEFALTEKILKELTPGTLFRGFFLKGFDDEKGRMWYFNFVDPENASRELNSSVYYPTMIKYFKAPLAKLEALSLAFTERLEIGLILDVQDLATIEESNVSTWYAAKIKTKSQKILAVECFLAEDSCVGTFLVFIDEAKKKVYII
jgi:hypothetical protein